jgi:hypothetical protein
MNIAFSLVEMQQARRSIVVPDAPEDCLVKRTSSIPSQRSGLERSDFVRWHNPDNKTRLT